MKKLNGLFVNFHGVRASAAHNGEIGQIKNLSVFLSKLKWFFPKLKSPCRGAGFQTNQWGDVKKLKWLLLKLKWVSSFGGPHWGNRLNRNV